MQKDRGEFSSRLGFIMAAAGSAVGLGNVWGFPTNTASNGGAAFVFMYLILAFCLAYPALMAELTIGRHTRANMVTALQTIATNPLTRILGRLTGLYGIIVASLILSFYTIVAGWMVANMLAPLAEVLGMAPLGQWLTGGTIGRNLFFALLFAGMTMAVISAGVEQGIEKWSTRLMPSLLALLVLLIIYVLFQEGALEGLKVYLLPDFSRITEPKLMVSALGQAFFSLSLGVGTMLIYGSYISRQENLPAIGAIVTVVDVSIAFLSGLLIIPAMFVAQHLGIQIYDDGQLLAGPNLIFQVLPALFESMGAVGYVVATLFFALMTIAALTSSISMLEVPVAFTVETANLERKPATWLIGLVIFSISALIIVFFDTLFSRVVDLTTKYSQPLLGIMLCVFAGWIWHRNSVLEELRHGNPAIESTVFWKIWPFYVKVFCPLLILLTFLQGAAE